MQLGELTNEVAALKEKHPGARLAVITGGEPMRQQIGPLVIALLNQQFIVQIETNGLLMAADLPYGDPNLWIVCSPKVGKVNPSLERYVDAFKYVVEIDNTDNEDGLPLTTLGNTQSVHRPTEQWFQSLNKRKMPRSKDEIFIAPLDIQDAERNNANTNHAVELCQKFGYRLSIQTHKILGLE